MRTQFVATVIAGLCLASNAAARPANIILIMADDVGWECFGCYGSDEYQTPHIDALAARGVRFENCFSTPICTPSRVKIMTGKYSFRNYTHFGYLDPKEMTFGQRLRAAGYQTAVAGKWQLNGLYHQAEGCDDNTRPIQAGFDEYCLWQLTRMKNSPGGGERFWSPPLEQNGMFLSKKDNAGKYGPDIMSDFLCDFIERNRDVPFFCYYPMVLVHNPFIPTPDTIGDRPRTHDTNLSPKGGAERKANFVAMVNYMDKLVGNIVRKVEEVGQLENTIILFTADNGTNRGITSTWKGMKITGGKGTTLDMGTHVPLVAYWKGHTPEGAVLDDLIDFSDFFPTLIEAAGAQPAQDDPIDGRSFLPQLQGKEGQPRGWVFGHYQPYWGKFGGRQYVRNDAFKLYRDGSFFHVPDDLKEERNLTDGQHGDRGEAARRMLGLVLASAPPAPPVEAGRNAATRPIHPDWPNLTTPAIE